MDLFARRTGLQFFRCCGFTSICTGLVLPADNFVQSLGRADQSVPLPAWGLRFLSVFCSDHSPTMNRFWALDVGQTDRQTDGRIAALLNAQAVQQWRGQQFSVQLPTSASNVTLLAFAAEQSAAVDRYLLLAGPTAANPPHVAAAVDRCDRLTDIVPLRRPCRVICEYNVSNVRLQSSNCLVKPGWYLCLHATTAVCPPSPLTGWVSPFETRVDAPRMHERVRYLIRPTFLQSSFRDVGLASCSVGRRRPLASIRRTDAPPAYLPPQS